MRKLLFQNIRVIDSNASSDTFKDVLVGEKNIVGVDKPFSIRNSNFKILEHPKTSILMPGIVDLRAESKDPGEPPRRRNQRRNDAAGLHRGPETC